MKTEKAVELVTFHMEFIQQWGDLISRYGFSRSAGQIMAALFLTDAERPLSTGELASILKLSRSTLTVGITELLTANLITTVRILGSRREHYRTSSDGWALCACCVRALMHRDTEPTSALLKSTVARHVERHISDGNIKSDDGALRRLKSLDDAYGKICDFIHNLLDMDMPEIRKFLSLSTSEMRRTIK